MVEKTLETLFIDTLKDIYYAERQILKALPKMERAAQSPALKDAFRGHREETEGQVERLQKVFEMVGKRAQAKTCPAILGILEEGDELIAEYSGSPAIDAALTGIAQAVEHYEMARYGALCTWAGALGHNDAVTLLQTTLDQEKNADKKLTTIASEVNATAIAAE